MPKRIFSETELTYLRNNWFEPICDLAAHLNAGESTIRKVLGEIGYVRPRGKQANLQLRSKENRKLVSNKVPEAWHDLPLTRQEAIDLGSSRYWDGKPCVREGHLSTRKTSSGGCWECDLMDDKNRKKTDPKLIAYYRELEKKRWADPAKRKQLQELQKKRLASEHGKNWLREWKKNKVENDINYVIAKSLRDRLYAAIKSQDGRKLSSAVSLLGCEISEFKEFLSLQFNDGMSWENYGIKNWHIDHVRPCMSFDMEDEGQQLVCFNWRNMRPLSAFENLSKKDSYSKDKELAWVERMRDLGFEGELYLRY